MKKIRYKKCRTYFWEDARLIESQQLAVTMEKIKFARLFHKTRLLKGMKINEVPYGQRIVFARLMKTAGVENVTARSFETFKKCHLEIIGAIWAEHYRNVHYGIMPGRMPHCVYFEFEKVFNPKIKKIDAPKYGIGYYQGKYRQDAFEQYQRLIDKSFHPKTTNEKFKALTAHIKNKDINSFFKDFFDEPQRKKGGAEEKLKYLKSIRFQ